MDMKIVMNNHCCEVFFSHQFTFADNPAFKQVIDLVESPSIHAFILDFREVTFIDSSVLGMMMILRNTAATKGQNVAIRGANGQPEKVMRISQFDAKFTMLP